MNTELKPCPFCESTNIGKIYVTTYSADSSYDKFGCKDCGASFVDGDATDWNRRPEQRWVTK